MRPAWAGGPCRDWRGTVELMWVLVALGAYVVVMRWILPRFGVPT